MDEPTCATCRFYLDGGRIGEPPSEGWCRRYPPITRLFRRDATAPDVFVSPAVDAEDWCGEHQPRPAG
jgi:hypothetical protein